ncbi:MAG: MATE family efflux transporter [Succinivibrio sp.]
MIIKADNTQMNRTIIKNILMVGLPVALQSALVALLSLTDVVMVSSFGLDCTAAVGLASKWHMLVIMIMAGIAQACGILIAQFYGKNDQQGAKSVFVKSLKTGLLVLLVPVLALTVFPKIFLSVQTDSQDIIEAGSIYLVYCSFALLLTFFVVLCESAMRSSGDGVTPLVIGSVTILTNIFLNYCLIGGNFGFEALGVKGAALATSYARIFQIVLLCLFFYLKRHWLFNVKSSLLTDSVRVRLLRLCLSCSLSCVAFATAQMITQIIIGKTGTIELAAFCLLDPFFSLLYALFFGLSVAASVSIGGFLGKRAFDSAQYTAKAFLKYSSFIGALTGIAIYLLQGPIIRLLNFQENQFEIASFAITFEAAICTLCIFNLMLINGILRAGGQNTFTLVCSLISYWIISLPLMCGALLLGGSFYQIFPMLYSGEIAALFMLLYGYRRKKWLADLTV